MRRPTFLEGVGVAFVLALAAGLGLFALSSIMAGPLLVRALIMCVSALYVMYLLIRSRHRSGRVALSVAWLVAAVLIWFLAPSFAWFAAVHVGLIWLVRVMFHHEGFLSAVVDLALGVISLAAAFATAQQTGSLFLAVWSFFLCQALFVLCTRMANGRSPGFENDVPDGFDRAARAANSALRRLPV